MIDPIGANTYVVQGSVTASTKVANSKKNFDLQDIEKSNPRTNRVENVSNINKSASESTISEEKDHRREVAENEQKHGQNEKNFNRGNEHKNNDSNKNDKTKHSKSANHLLDTVA